MAPRGKSEIISRYLMGKVSLSLDFLWKKCVTCDRIVHSAINNVLNNPDFGIHRAVVFTGYDLNISGDTVYYPVYMAGFLRKNREMKILEPIEFD